MTRLATAWDAVVHHTKFATLDDWFFVTLTVVVVLALLTPMVRRVAL